ncbi:MAG: glycosyltransferase family 1 protein [Kiritimatiellae bacterium]|nr:glycosyltransferase family 1 protein [Kiritimatiellia bacterium]MDD5521561.1 glycosyltransferase family 1 protein [Kiritimatiellia bacterium]
MKVCIDIQSTIAQRAGVGRYTKQLIQHLGTIKCPDDSLSLFYFDFKRRGLPFDPSGASIHAVHCCPGRLAQTAWKTIGWPPFNFFAPGADLYHFPNFILPPLTEGRSVVTVHDMSFLRFPQFAEKRNLDYLSSKIRDTAKRANALITDSHFSAHEIRELLNVPSEKIFPIHLGISGNFKAPHGDDIAAVLSALNITRPYLLTVGTLEPRKNIDFLVDVFEKMTFFDGKLVIAGMRGWKYKPVLQRIENSSRCRDIHYIEYVEDSQLPAIYAGAELFICTSLYEGFGFPPLEAMACGVPVLSSDGGSLGEVLGNGALILKEFNSDLWTTQAEKLLGDTDMRKRLITEGQKTAAKYTWTETARKTWEVYKKTV